MEDNSRFDVMGSGAFYVLDAHESNGSNVSEAYDQDALSIFDVRRSLLAKGDYFNLIDKKAYKNVENIYSV
ncbi:MAG: hypothetical protein H7336_12410 [Bacteriovorax sp.]|nr:hypothetical protein [Bacteriovorax sp.]